MNESSLSIAIIGMAGRFPGAENVDAFWEMLKAGREGIRRFSDAELLAAGVSGQQLQEPNFVKAGSVLPGALDFDVDFFGMSRRDADITDPQQRLFLEQVWHALEQAGYPSSTTQARIGLYAGVSDNSYQRYYLEPRLEELLDEVGHYRLFTLSGKDFIATRTAYLLNLTGPAMTIQTACSTSLVAVHTACQSLLNDECDIALAGGASVYFPQISGYIYQEGMILSPDGRCRAFDAQAQGAAPGSGVAVVALKRLEEAVADSDTIHAVICGSAVNNDGFDKVGYTAPSVQGQREVIREALSVAGVLPEQITYIEAHGTATPLGDPIEVQALTQAFRCQTERVGYCALGSVKSNIGHADVTAGVAGLIKTALALHHRQIPPSLHFHQPNTQLELADSPFFVNDTLRDWHSDGPRYAGVSSFGIGGTNAHVILEQAPAPRVSVSSRPLHLFTLSAKTPAALQQSQVNLLQCLTQLPQTAHADVAYTLNRGRHAFRQRAFWVGEEPPKAALPSRTAPEQAREVLFLFPGQGSQYPGMTRVLYHTETVFREALDECAGHLRPYLDSELTDILYARGVDLQQTALTQPVLFAVEYALTQLWISWGIRPKGLLGHSLGEYVAACLAGLFSLKDALRLVAERGRLIQKQPAGAMVAVPLAEAALQDWLNPDLSVCVVNGTQRCVVGGSPDAVAELQTRLQARGIESRLLHTSHAFHSHLMEPVLPAFQALLQTVTFKPPTQPWLSNLTGDWISPEQAVEPEYWCRHLRHTVRFADNLGQALAGGEVLLEVGPGQTLTALARQHPGHTRNNAVLASLPNKRDNADSAELEHCLTTLGQLWSQGVEVDWDGFYQDEHRCRIPLPTYPFERRRYCVERETIPAVDSNTLPASPAPTVSIKHTEPSESARQIARLWSESLGVPVEVDSDFFEFGGDSLLATQVIARMNRHFGTALDAHALLQAPTPAQMAISLKPSDTDRKAQTNSVISDLVVPIQDGDPNHPPLVLLHPVGGHVYFYCDLARRLDPALPVYGIRAVGVHGEAEPLTTIDEMAEVYTAALKTLQPVGPYHLAGASFGGTLAYAIAQRLIAEQETVAFLGLIDTPSTGNMPVELEDEGVTGILFYLLTVGHKLEIDHAAFTNLNEAQQFDFFFQHTGQENTSSARRELRIVLKLFQVNMCAMRDYEPGPYPGRLHFFLACERDAFNAQTPAHGWIPLAEQGIEIYTVPGDHISMNHEPHVQHLADTLKPLLQETKQ